MLEMVISDLGIAHGDAPTASEAAKISILIAQFKHHQSLSCFFLAATKEPKRDMGVAFPVTAASTINLTFFR